MDKQEADAMSYDSTRPRRCPMPLKVAFFFFVIAHNVRIVGDGRQPWRTFDVEAWWPVCFEKSSDPRACQPWHMLAR